MQADTIHFPELDSRNGACVADGYGMSVSVNRRQLVVSDGIGRRRRSRTFAKATCGMTRLVVLGHTGSVSFEALRWLVDAGVAFLQIDEDGQVLFASGPYGRDDARLRRAQALAPYRPEGLEISRQLLSDKLLGQLEVARRLEDGEQACERIEASLVLAQETDELQALLNAESQGAAAYWGAWADVPMHFATRDVVAAHWRTFGARSSALTGSPRLASNPANAVLNYLYAILEAETRIACLAVGLDPGLGFFHTDQKSRDSLACDVMEAVRPQVDAFLLDLLASRTFRAADFVETRKGVCRVLAPLTHQLAETAPMWARLVAPVVEQVAIELVRASGSGLTVPTPLTQANRSAGRKVERPAKVTRPKSMSPPKLAAACLSCGGTVPAPDRLYCNNCLPEVRAEQQAAFVASGPEVLAARRADGCDPAHGGETARKRGSQVRTRADELRQWEHMNEQPDSRLFIETVLPCIESVSVTKLTQATGLSRRYCWLVRKGERVPHARHWEQFRCAGGSV